MTASAVTRDSSETDAPAGDVAAPEPGSDDEPTVRRTRRWRGVAAIALFTSAAGVLTASPSILLLGVVGAGFAAYPRLSTPPSPDLELEREVEPEAPERGESVRVTVRVRNVGGRTLPDVRLVDGVPPMLPVTDGTPRHAALLRPGATTEYRYAVRATRGRHRFNPMTVIARDATGATEVETTVEAETTVECVSEAPETPLRRRATDRSGRVVTDEGGSGVEFHSTREYRRGDPINRIDWRRRARTGELATVEFREERAASVVLCVDTRPAAYRAAASGEPHGVAYGVSGADQLLSTLSERRDFVGLASLGRDRFWLPPGTGADHHDRTRRLLDGHPAFSTRPPETDDEDRRVANSADERRELARERARTLKARLDADVQVVLLSPLTDEFPATLTLALEADGAAVTVVSPDVTSDGTVGGRLARVERANRIRTLRAADVPVVDWNPDEPLGSELIREEERR